MAANESSSITRPTTANGTILGSTEAEVDVPPLAFDLLQYLLTLPGTVNQFFPILISLASIIVIFGLSANILLIIGIWKSPKMHSSANLIVVTMCFADLWRVLHIMLFDLLSGITQRWQYDRTTTCAYASFMVQFTAVMTGLLLCLVSVNRLVMITFHAWYAKMFSVRHTVMMLTVVIISSLLICVPVIIPGTQIYSLYSEHTGSCYPYDASESQAYQLTGIFVSVVLPTLIMLPTYSWICYFVLKSRRRVVAHDTRQQRSQPSGFKEELRSAIVILLAYISYFIFYIPLYASYIASLRGVMVPNEVLVVSSYLSDFYRFIRPMLYPGMGISYRDAIIRLFSRRRNSVTTITLSPTTADVVN